MELSIVVPVYRSADCLPALAERVKEEAEGRYESYELILVNDFSPDESWDVIRELAGKYEFVTGVNLRKNVGQDNAIMAGFHHVRGRVVVVMDDDLQHDPADIPRLCEGIEAGADVVYANFGRKKQAVWKNLGSRLNDRVAVILLDKPKDIYMSPFKAIRREVVDEIIRYRGPYSYVDGIIFTITSAITQIVARHGERHAGKSNYDLRRSIRVWLKLVTSFSVIPLRMATVVGGVIALLSFLLGTYFIVETVVIENPVEGWASTTVAVFFLGGVQLVGLGALGEYVGRMFITVNRRSQFVVKETTRP